MYDQLYSYLTKYELLSNSQFGFREFHSTATALLDCTNDWYMNIDRKKFNLVVLIDLKKELDTVDHQLLHRGQKSTIVFYKYLVINQYRIFIYNNPQTKS